MSELLRPLWIGSVRIPNNLVLSPMAGFTDVAHRAVCRSHGAGLVCTEMVASPGVVHGALYAEHRMRTTATERPVSVQVFGSDTEEAAQAARTVEAHCDIIGFNLGCPSFQVQKVGCGAALLDRPGAAAELVRAIADATRRPVLAKMRIGNASRIDLRAFPRALEAAGAAALIVHGRTAAQGYSGSADRSAIRTVKEAVGIPVVANGDIVDGPSAARALRETGADGVAIGRASLGDPRVFRAVSRYLADGEVVAPPTVAERLSDYLAYAALAEPAGIPLPQARNQAQKFARGFPGARRLRVDLSHAPSYAALMAAMLAASRPQASSDGTSSAGPVP